MTIWDKLDIIQNELEVYHLKNKHDLNTKRAYEQSNTLQVDVIRLVDMSTKLIEQLDRYLSSNDLSNQSEALEELNEYRSDLDWITGNILLEDFSQKGSK